MISDDGKANLRGHLVMGASLDKLVDELLAELEVPDKAK